MIRRNRLYEKKEPSRDAQKVYILCEGDDREYNYFLFFQKMSSNLQLVVIPPWKIAEERATLTEWNVPPRKGGHNLIVKVGLFS